MKSSGRSLPTGRISRFDSGRGRRHLYYVGGCLCPSVAFE